MILITYQKVFDFTHNDLHTNNIMYVKQKNNSYIINIIKNIIKFRHMVEYLKLLILVELFINLKVNVICSDSYHQKVMLLLNIILSLILMKKKPRLEPNKSFDLCRLACSLFDYFIDDIAM